MEYVHGEYLNSMIRMSESLSLGRLLSVGKQICDGLRDTTYRMSAEYGISAVAASKALGKEEG